MKLQVVRRVFPPGEELSLNCNGILVWIRPDFSSMSVVSVETTLETSEDANLVKEGVVYQSSKGRFTLVSSLVLFLTRFECSLFHSF